jgi:redox-sensing transcriptional repressor
MKEQQQLIEPWHESTLERFRLYQPLLRLCKYKNQPQLTLTIISDTLNIPRDIVLHDLMSCLSWDKEEPEHLQVDGLIDFIAQKLGQKEYQEALLIGIGKLGNSLLRNEAIAGSGLKIVAAFDIDPEKVGTTIGGIKVQNIHKLSSFVDPMHLKMALIATTPENAQQAASFAIAAGIHVIWNFTAAAVSAHEGIIIQNTLSSLEIDQDYQKILSRL